MFNSGAGLVFLFYPVVASYMYAKAAVCDAHESTKTLLSKVPIAGMFVPTALTNKINVLKTKLAMMVLASNETLADLNSKLGVLYLVKGEFQPAETYLKTAVSLVPANFMFHYYLALFHGRKNNHNEMVACYKSAIEMLDYKKPEKSAAKQWLHGLSGT